MRPRQEPEWREQRIGAPSERKSQTLDNKIYKTEKKKIRVLPFKPGTMMLNRSSFRGTPRVNQCPVKTYVSPGLDGFGGPTTWCPRSTLPITPSGDVTGGVLENNNLH